MRERVGSCRCEWLFPSSEPSRKCCRTAQRTTQYTVPVACIALERRPSGNGVCWCRMPWLHEMPSLHSGQTCGEILSSTLPLCKFMHGNDNPRNSSTNRSLEWSAKDRARAHDSRGSIIQGVITMVNIRRMRHFQDAAHKGGVNRQTPLENET